MSETPALPTIVISRLANGPTPPTAASAVWPNVLHTRVADLVKEMGPGPWARRIIADERQLVTLISSPPGAGNRPHWHRDFDEWWVVMAGRAPVGADGRHRRPGGEGRHRLGAAGHRPPHPNAGDAASLRLAVAMPPADPLLLALRAVRLHGRRSPGVERLTAAPARVRSPRGQPVPAPMRASGARYSCPAGASRVGSG